MDSDWTVDTLREYIDSKFSSQEKAVNAALIAQDKAVNAALAAQDKAITKAEEADAKRFESVNEFRDTLTDQATSFISRAEAEAKFKAQDDKLERTLATQKTLVVTLIIFAITTGVTIAIAVMNTIARLG